jgi:hypothetical protein
LHKDRKLFEPKLPFPKKPQPGFAVNKADKMRTAKPFWYCTVDIYPMVNGFHFVEVLSIAKQFCFWRTKADSVNRLYSMRTDYEYSFYEYARTLMSMLER